MNAKERFTDDVMSSLDGADRATLDQSVREDILRGMQGAGYGMRDAGYRIDSLKFSLVWKIAAIMLLLISLNVFTMMHFSKSTVSSLNATKSVALEYFSYINHYNL
ncbi:MAG: hypothetical protein NTW31_06930 [Bacteroidetes bacterium]|nr:hypothetical protein [Bacteroidota bacterium]